MDITKYFSPTRNDRFDGRTLNSDCLSTSSQICAGKELNLLQEKLSFKGKYQIIYEKTQKDIAIRAWKYGISEACK